MIHIAAAFVAGLLVKTVDWLDDERKSKNPLKYILGAVYGIVIGYLIGNASFSLIFLAALIAQVVARKIDTVAHRIGFAASILTAVFFQVPSIDLYVLGYFMVLAFLDEIDYMGKLRPLTRYRPFLKVGALPLVLLGRLDYFIGIMAFDIGYELFNVLKNHIK